MPSRKLILIVDDDNDIREAIRDLVEFEGYDTAQARDGGAGLEYLRSQPAPGVILLDWNMAPMGGAAFMAEFSHDADLSAIPVVLMTADVRSEAKAKALGLSSFLTKPIDIGKLMSIAERYCSR